VAHHDRVTTSSPHLHDVDGQTVALGRVPQWDDNNARYLAAPRAVDKATRLRVMHRAFVPVLNQDDVGACEAFQGIDALGCAPLHKTGEYTARTATDAAFRLYEYVTHNDEFDGAWTYNGNPDSSPHGSGDDTGTSTLALCKALKAMGKISRYEWITGDDPELLLHHLDKGGADNRGTVILTGWGWTRSMCQTGSDGQMTVKGPDIGGHATTLRGYNRHTGRLCGRNHWTTRWGLNGEYEIRLTDAGNRMRENGDQAVIYR
jgi:hypothetical protein